MPISRLLAKSVISKNSKRLDPDVDIKTRVNLRDLVSYQCCDTYDPTDQHQWYSTNRISVLTDPPRMSHVLGMLGKPHLLFLAELVLLKMFMKLRKAWGAIRDTYLE